VIDWLFPACLVKLIDHSDIGEIKSVRFNKSSNNYWIEKRSVNGKGMIGDYRKFLYIVHNAEQGTGLVLMWKIVILYFMLSTTFSINFVNLLICDVLHIPSYPSSCYIIRAQTIQFASYNHDNIIIFNMNVFPGN
jgi:hypothetical protein